MTDFMRNSAGNPGRSAHKLAKAADETINTARATIAKFIGAEEPSCVAFTSNCSDGLNTAIHGFLRAGDHVVTSVFEHNSILRPLRGLKDRGVITADYIDPDRDLLLTWKQLQPALKSNTRLVALTHCANAIGILNPLEEIGAELKKRGIAFLVDTAQSTGIAPVNVKDLEATMLAFPGHKGMFGPMGTGVLYVRKGTQLRSVKQGGTGYKAEDDVHPEEMPYAAEVGTPNAPGIAGLFAGTQYVSEKSVLKIMEHENRLANMLIDGTRGLPGLHQISPGGKRQLAPVSFDTLPKRPVELAKFLDAEFSIGVRGALHCAPLAHKYFKTFPEGTLRFSFGLFNTEEEVDYSIKALKSIFR